MSHLSVVPNTPDIDAITGMDADQRDVFSLGQIAYTAYYGGDTDYDRWPQILESFNELAAVIVAEYERRRSMGDAS